MKVNKLITDTRPIDQPAGSHVNAFNILIDKAKKAVVNEYGFEYHFYQGKKVIHAMAIDDDQVILWSVNNSTQGPEGSRITRLNSKGEAQVIVDDDALNFSVNNTIKSVFVYNFKGELVIIWEDYQNPSRMLNCDNVYPVLDGTLGFFDPEDVNLLNINPYNVNGYIQAQQVLENGGQLKSGVYYFTSCYEIPDGTLTPWGTIQGPVSIIEDHIETDFDLIEGTDPDTPTTKSIELLISNIDTRYKYMRLAVIKKIGELVTVEEFSRFKIATSVETVHYTGGEASTDLVLEEVLTPGYVYNSAKTLTLIGNTLTRGNLKANPFKEYNYQPIANNITIDWVTEDIDLDNFEGSYKNPFLALTKRGYFPDEVYAFYLRLHFIDGSKSDAFHIPGPSQAGRSIDILGNGGQQVTDKIKTLLNDSTLTQYTTPFLDEATVVDKTHFAEDLNIEEDVKFFQTRETAMNRATDNMGVWYNESENYPDDANVWGALAGTPVRHHKFPSLEVISNYNTTTDEPPIDGELQLNQVWNLSMNYIKSESFGGQYANADGGKVFSIPLSVVEQGTIAISEQSQNTINNNYYHDTTESTNIAEPDEGYSIYKHVDSSNWDPLFFIANHPGAATVRVHYDVTWKYNADARALSFGSDAQISLDFLRPELDIDLAGEYGNGPHYFSDSIINVEKFDQGLSANNNQVITTSGFVDIPMSNLSSLAFTCKYLHLDNNQVNFASDVDIDFTFYDVNIRIQDLDADPIQVNKGKVLGIDVKNVDIPVEISDSVVGYEILYAKRDADNMRILGQSLAFGSAPHPLFENEIGSHAGNHPTHHIREGEDTSAVGIIRDDKLRLHPFDMLLNKPDLKASYVKAQQYLEAKILNNKPVGVTSISYNPDPESTEAQDRLTEDSPIQAHYLVDFKKNRTLETSSKILESRRLRAVKNMKYLPAEGVIKDDRNTINNSYSEECVTVDVEHAIPLTNTLEGSEVDTTFGWLPANEEFSYRTPADTADVKCKYFLVNLYLHRKDVYKSMFEQELVSTGKVHFINRTAGNYNTGKLFGGDTFLNYYGIRLTGAIYYDPDGAAAPNYFTTNQYEVLKNVFHFPCYSSSNIGLRTSGTDLKDSYYPKVGTLYNEYEEWLKRAADFSNTNSLLYNRDYTSLNDLAQVSPYNTEEDFFSKFPYRIIKSKPYLPEDKEFSLREFLSNDFYEMPKNKGEIINLQGYGSILMIHHKYALFKTATQDRLSTNATEVVLGTGELFSVEPTEINPSESGYAGLQNQGAALLTDAGYLFIDTEQGKIFLVGQNIEEISAKGMEEFFRTRLKFKLAEQLSDAGFELTTTENPYCKGGVGYNLAYDSEFGRLLISKKDLEVLDMPTLIANSANIENVTNGLVFTGGRLMHKFNGELLELSISEELQYFKDISYTLSYDVELKSWISKHTYIPDVMVSTRNKVFSFRDTVAYIHNDRTSHAKFYALKIEPSFVDVVFNPAPKVTKQFPSVHWISEVIDSSNHSTFKDTLTHIAAFNSYQNTGLIALEDMVNIRNVEGTWNFNTLRDIIDNRNLPHIDEDFNIIDTNLNTTLPYYDKRRMVDKYLIVRFYFDNSSQKTLYLYDLAASFIKSHR